MVEESSLNTRMQGSALVPFLLALILLGLDFILGFDGIDISLLLNNFSNFLVTMGKTLVIVAIGLGALVYFLNHASEEHKVNAGVYVLFGAFTAFIFLFAGSLPNLLHLLLLYFIITSLRAPGMTHRDKIITIIVFYFIDFFIYGIASTYIQGVNPELRFILPLYLLYVMSKAQEYESSMFLQTVYKFFIIFIFVAIIFYAIDVGYRYNYSSTASPEEIAKGVGHFYTLAYGNFVGLLVESGSSFRQLFNTSGYYDTGQQQETKNPQGVFLTEIDKGDYTNYNGTPVYLWARFEARTLDKPIDPVKVRCSAEDKDGNVTEGIVNEESTEYNFLVISGVDRTISCRFDDLDVGRYKAIFNATFDFATEATRKIYLINRERYMEELQALNQKGQQATGKDVLRQLKITDISPETIYTSGPVAIGIATDNVPWDIGDEGNIKHRFGITAKNEWKKGGEILKINKMEMIVPSTFDLITSSCDVKLQSAGVKDGDKVYSTTKVIDDIDEFKTINCLMNVNKQSLDTVPVTTRFLKAHVDYTYMITEEIDFKVEALPGATI
ncbi:MAG: hypothetical protein AABW92_01475 [Nanoarchaeota archaeon]